MSATTTPKYFKTDSTNFVPGKYFSYQAKSDFSMDRTNKDVTQFFPKLPITDGKLPTKYRIFDNSSEVFADKFSSIWNDLASANKISIPLKKTFHQMKKDQDDANNIIVSKKKHKISHKTLITEKNDLGKIDKTYDSLARKESSVQDIKDKTTKILKNLKPIGQVFDEIYAEQQSAYKNIDNLKDVKIARLEFKKVLKKLDLDRCLNTRGIKCVYLI